MRFRECKLARDTSIPVFISTLATTLNQFQKTVMPNAEAVELRKTIEKKKDPQCKNILKESIDAITISQRILDLGVNLSVGELLG